MIDGMPIAYEPIADDLNREIDAAEQAEQHHREEQDRLDKLRKIIKVSESLEISQIAQLLAMDEAQVLEYLVEWGEQFGIKIKGKEVIFSQGDTNAFIDSLEKEFADWDQKTRKKDGKLEIAAEMAPRILLKWQ